MSEQNTIQIIVAAFQEANTRGDRNEVNNWDNDSLMDFLESGPYIFDGKDDEALIETAGEVDIQDSDAMMRFMKELLKNFKAGDPKSKQDDTEAQNEIFGAFVEHFTLGDLVEIFAWRHASPCYQFDRKAFQFRVIESAPTKASSRKPA